MRGNCKLIKVLGYLYRIKLKSFVEKQNTSRNRKSGIEFRVASNLPMIHVGLCYCKRILGYLYK